MRITGYRTLRTVHQWGRPIGDVNGVVASGVTDVPIVLVSTDVGLTGVGIGAHAGLEAVFPALEGEDPRAVASLYDRMLATVFKTGHAGSVFSAIGSFDMALWDLKAKAAETPLWRLLGARSPVVPAYASCLDAGLDDERLVSVHREFADRGFGAVKLKGGLDRETDRRRLTLIRELYADVTGAIPALMLDANESWARKQAVQHVAFLERTLDLAWVEEPVRRWDVDGHLAVGRGVRAAIATGENLTGLEQFRPLVAASAVDIVQTGSVGGVTHFLRVAALAHAFDLPVSPVAYNCNPLAHAAASVPNHLAIEVQDLSHPVGLRVDQQVVDGAVVLGESPGIGIEVDEQAIADNPVASGTWGSGDGPHVRPERAGRRLSADLLRPGG